MNIIQTIATTLSVTQNDVFVLGVGLVLWVILLVMGIQRTYGVYFGMVVGVAIYLMLTVLLSPQYQTPDTAKIFSPQFSQFLIGSSAYLIFILMILTPISGGIRFPQTNNKVLRGFELIGVSIFVLTLILALVIGFANRTYIFGIDTGFLLLRKLELYNQLAQGEIFMYVSSHIQPIILFGVLFLLYKILFSEIVGVLILTVWYWILSLRNRGNAAAAEESLHDDGHGHGGHELDDLDLDLGHDDGHGGGHDDSHGHGGHH